MQFREAKFLGILLLECLFQEKREHTCKAPGKYFKILNLGLQLF